MPTRDLTHDCDFPTPINEFDARLIKVKLAQDDLDSPDVHEDEDVAYFSDIREEALRELVFYPVDCPGQLSIKMAWIFREDNADWVLEQAAQHQLIGDISRVEKRLKKAEAAASNQGQTPSKS